MRDPDHILITGASSGIGEALALLYAKPGRRLTLSGRNAERTEAVAAAVRAKGAEATARVIDVADKPAMRDWIADVDAQQPLDLVIANAGIAQGKATIESLDEAVERVFAVNVHGVFNTVHPVLPAMKARGRGQVALMASIAGFRGLPGSAPYSASKVAVKGYGEALRGAVARHGIEVSVICPGFVTSRMTDGARFPMPFLMPADRAAEIIARGLVLDKGIIAFPWPTYAAARALTLLPAPLTDWILKKR